MAGVIKGWAEALGTHENRLEVGNLRPSRARYGAKQFNMIPPNSTLIFEVELLSIANGNDSGATAIEARPEPILPKINLAKYCRGKMTTESNAERRLESEP